MTAEKIAKLREKYKAQLAQAQEAARQLTVALAVLDELEKPEAEPEAPKLKVASKAK